MPSVITPANVTVWVLSAVVMVRVPVNVVVPENVMGADPNVVRFPSNEIGLLMVTPLVPCGTVMVTVPMSTVPTPKAVLLPTDTMPAVSSEGPWKVLLPVSRKVPAPPLVRATSDPPLILAEIHRSTSTHGSAV